MMDFITVSRFLFVASFVCIAFAEIRSRQNLVQGDIKDVVWMGVKDLHVRTDAGMAYHSGDAGYSFKPFSECSAQGCVLQFTRSPSEDLILYHGEATSWLVNANGTVASVIRSPLDKVAFHPTEPDWLLASFCDQQGELWESMSRRKCRLLLSTDRGATLTKVVPSIISNIASPLFGWGCPKAQYFNRFAFFYIRPEREPTDTGGGTGAMMNNLYQYDFSSKKETLKLSYALAFAVAEDFLLTAQSRAAKLGSAGSGAILFTSNTNGLTFQPIHLPTDDPQFRYTVLDVSEHTLFLNVFHQEMKTWGTTYLSDPSGQWFSPSLQFTHRNPDGVCDFHRVKGLQGVYIANAIAEMETALDCQTCEYQDCDEECPYQSRISYDRGRTWQPLPVPASDPVCGGSATELCSLHLHGFASTDRSHDNIKSHPMSPGFILSSGNTGRKLHMGEVESVDLYMSRDGGESFHKIKSGRWTYGFADHGGLIVVAATKPTTAIEYSLDEGRSWAKYEFTEKPEDVVSVKRILYNPDAPTAHSILLETETIDEQGRLYYLDFEGLAPDCQGAANPYDRNSDYEWWSPHAYNSRCYLGRIEKFVVKRYDTKKICWDPMNTIRPVEGKNCSCTLDDFECDFGFKNGKDEKGNAVCVRDSEFAILNDTCVNGMKRITYGYVKTYGDTCQGGLEWMDVHVVSCEPSKFFVSALLLLLILPCTCFVLGLFLHAKSPAARQAMDAIFIRMKKGFRGRYRPLRGGGGDNDPGSSRGFYNDAFNLGGDDDDDDDDEDDEDPRRTGDRGGAGPLLDPNLANFTGLGIQSLPVGGEGEGTAGTPAAAAAGAGANTPTSGGEGSGNSKATLPPCCQNKPPPAATSSTQPAAAPPPLPDDDELLM